MSRIFVVSNYLLTHSHLRHVNTREFSFIAHLTAASRMRDKTGDVDLAVVFDLGESISDFPEAFVIMA